MQPNSRTLLRAAECIRFQLYRAAAAQEIELPEAHWTECQALVRQLARAAERRWINAAAILRDRLDRALKGCSERLQEIVRQVSSSHRRPAPPTARDVFRDLN